LSSAAIVSAHFRSILVFSSCGNCCYYSPHTIAFHSQ
jgi:hypothetical protein